MRSFQPRLAMLLIAMAMALAACGGGDGDGIVLGAGGGGPGDTPGSPTTQVPASAQGSVAGLIAYLQQLIAETSETSSPVLLGDAVLPTDDTAEPSAVR